jgi:hypothetical protein
MKALCPYLEKVIKELVGRFRIDFGFLGDDRQTSGLRNVSNDYYGSFLGNNEYVLGLGLSTRWRYQEELDKDTVLNKGILKKNYEGSCGRIRIKSMVRDLDKDI